MAPIIDIGVELARSRREALRVRFTDNCAAASRDKQRAGLKKITGRRDRQRIATRNVHILVDMQTSPNTAPRSIERRRRLRPPSNPKLPERFAKATYEETTDHSVPDTPLLAPPHKRHRLLKNNNPRHDLGQIMHHDVQSRPRTATEPHPTALVARVASTRQQSAPQTRRPNELRAHRHEWNPKDRTTKFRPKRCQNPRQTALQT